MGETDAMKDKIQGKFREVKGAATGDTGEEMKGKLQGLKGDAEHKMEQGRRKMEDEAEKRRREDVREEAREEARDEVNRRMP
jgi:uncharacterized protein YjbJ (UPF0337 family)